MAPCLGRPPPGSRRPLRAHPSPAAVSGRAFAPARRPAVEPADETLGGIAMFDVPASAQKERLPTLRFDLSDDEAAFSFSAHGSPAWSRSGRLLAFARNGDIWVSVRLGGRFSDDYCS